MKDQRSRKTTFPGRFCAAIVVLAAAGLSARATAAEAQHWASRLGYGDAKVLILHADDGGMFTGANTAIQDLLVKGEIQSASLMTPPAFYRDFVQWHNLQSQGYDIGVHLTLNGEWTIYRWPPASRPSKSVKRILEHKFFCWGWRPVLPNKIHTNWLCRAPNTVRAEMGQQAQVAIAGDPGADPAIPAMTPPPSHLDTHMGTVFVRKSHFKKYLDLALQTGIPALTFSNFEETLSCLSGIKQGEPEMELLRFVTLRVMSLRRAQRKFEEEHGWPFPRLDRYCVIPYDDALTLMGTKQKFKQLVLDLKPGITQFLFHPSDEDPWLRAVVAPATATKRIEIDREIFRTLDPMAPGYDAANDIQLFFTQQGIILTDWLLMMKRFEDPCTDPADGDPYVEPAECSP